MNRIATCLVIASVWTSQSAHGAEFLFGVPESMGEPINTTGIDHSHLSADGRSIYVTSGYGLGQPFGGGDGYKTLSVFRRASQSDPWGPRDDLGENVNGGGSTGVPSLTADELSLFYSDTIAHWGPIRGDGFGGGDLWVTTRASIDSPWGESINVEEVNSRYLDADATISADGLSLFFISNRPDGFGDNDIWTSNRETLESSWGEPQNLGPLVNGSVIERTPSISPDGLSLFYAKRGAQRPDLWVTSRTDAESPWQEPVNLGRAINTSDVELSPQLSADGSTFYFSRVVDNCSCPNVNFDMFSVDLLPFETVSVSAGSGAYSQDFDSAFGSDGNAEGTILPTGWTASDNGTVFSNATDRAFPVGKTLGAGGKSILNAGAEGDQDRTLAIGVRDRDEGGFFQLLAEVTGDDATSLQLQFDIEAWDAARVNSLGEAAFDVSLELDTGNGFSPLADLGRVTTGETVFPPAGDFLNGNADMNRISFDSGIVNTSLPEGSKLRVRWAAPLDAQTTGWVFGLDNVSLSLFGDESSTVLMAGDTDQDLDFDQLDLVQVQIAAKYLTGQPATWGEGDWNGAPGGEIGDPPAGDGLFNQFDIIAAQQAATYLTGPYAAIQPNGQRTDGQTSVVYDPSTGEMAVDAPADAELTSINIDSTSGIFTGAAAENLGGSFDNDTDNNIFKATFGSSFGSVSFGQVAQAGLSEEFVLGDLSVVGSLAGGGDLGQIDLVYVPEPVSAFLLAIGLAIGLLPIRRSHI